MNRRIVLACDDPGVVQRLLSVAGELDDEIVQVTATSSESVEAVAAQRPDVLLVVDGLGPVPVLDLIRQVARQYPFTGILLMATSNDAELLRLAMEAGARSVALTSATVDDLGQRIDNAASWAAIARGHIAAGGTAQQAGTGRVVTFTGSKGGVGTTTLAVHIALEAAAAGNRTCLVDLDLQTGDVSALLDVTHKRDIVDLVGVAGEITAQSLDDSLYRHASTLHVLLAPKEGERGEEVDDRVARSVLGALKSRFDVIVVDAGHVLSPAGAAAVEIADHAVIVATPDVLSVRGARRSVQLWNRLQLRREDDALVVLNRCSRRSEVQSDLAGRLVRLPVSRVTVPAAFKAFEAAVNTGDPTRVVDRNVRKALARVAAGLGVRDADLTAAKGGGPARPGRRRRADAGQVSLEFVGTLLFAGIILAALVQGALIGVSHELVGHAAAAAARVAVSPASSCAQIERAAADAVPGAWRDGQNRVELTGAGCPSGGRRGPQPQTPVQVTVRTPTFLPLVGVLFGDLRVSGTAAMQYEGGTS
jgi:pilus assembly protein CpaE